MKYSIARECCLEYNAALAMCWKVFAPAVKTAGGACPDSQSNRWEDSEIAELEKLARQATKAARQSMKLINTDKEEACRKQLLREKKEAK